MTDPSPGTTDCLRVAHCLAPHLGWFYRGLAFYLGLRVGTRIEFTADAAYQELPRSDLAFACSLAYVEYPGLCDHFEPIAAPVLLGSRYGGSPVYFSDVIVHHASPVRSFADLKGRSWAYNEVYSQSGYGITRYHLAGQPAREPYFARVVRAGRHDRAIEMVANGEVDAAAIDSHVLETYLRLHPSIAVAVRAIDSLGPSPIQPVLARRSLPAHTREALRDALLRIHEHASARRFLNDALVDRFVAVEDHTYEPIRTMRDVAAAVAF